MQSVLLEEQRWNEEQSFGFRMFIGGGMWVQVLLPTKKIEQALKFHKFTLLVCFKNVIATCETSAAIYVSYLKFNYASTERETLLGPNYWHD